MSASEQHKAGTARSFRLGPYEHQIWGLRHEGDRLRVRPSGGALLSRVGYGLLAVFFAFICIIGGLNPENFTFNGLPVRNGEPFVVLGVLGLAAMWADIWRRLRQQIVATPTGLSIRHGYFRTTHLRWNEVVNIAVGHHQDPGWDWNITITGAWIGPRTVTGYDWPIVETTSGRRIGIDGLATIGGSDEWNNGLQSGAEQRIEILRRFATQYRPAIQSPLKLRMERPWTPHWVRRVAVFALSAILVVAGLI